MKGEMYNVSNPDFILVSKTKYLGELSTKVLPSEVTLTYLDLLDSVLETDFYESHFQKRF